MAEDQSKKQQTRERVEDDMEGYVEVSERLEEFYGDHKEGSISTTWTIEKIPAPHEFPRDDAKKEVGKCKQCGVPIGTSETDMCDHWGFVVQAEAFRNPSDTKPGVGTAWEPYPGRTPFTRGAELQNGETSAWGRALAGLGYKVKNGIASANEMRGRQGNGEGGRREPSEGQVNFFTDLVREHMPEAVHDQVIEWAKAKLEGGKDKSMSVAIDGLLGKGDDSREDVVKRLTGAAAEWAKEQKAEGGEDKAEPPKETQQPQPKQED